MGIRDESQLIHDLRESSISAFNELFGIYHQRVLYFSFKILGSKEDAEEIVQTVFIAIWENRLSIDPERPFTSYLFSITRHHLYNTLKKRVYKSVFLEKLNNNDFKFDHSTEDEITYRELKTIFEQIIDHLPPKRKEIYKMNREEGLTYKQIAEKTGVSENTVDTQMRKSLEYIRETFNKLYK